MQIEHIDIDQLVFDPKNARKHNTKNLMAIKGSIKNFGVVEPLIVRRQNNVVIGGNGRLAVLKEMGLKKVPVHFVDIDEKQAKALGLALNKTAELAEWDDDLLKETIVSLDLAGFDLSDIGFNLTDEDIPAPLEREPAACENCGFVKGK